MTVKTTSIDPLMGTLPSTPPVGYFRVSNLYVNTEGKLKVEYDTNPASMGQLVSNPPVGNYQVMNLFVNNAGKLVIQYEDTPV